MTLDAKEDYGQMAQVCVCVCKMREHFVNSCTNFSDD